MTTLSGRVTLPGGAAARNAVVELHNVTGDVVDQVKVDDDGGYRYHVSPATWKVRAWDAHGHSARGEATVREGEDGRLDIELGTEEVR